MNLETLVGLTATGSLRNVNVKMRWEGVWGNGSTDEPIINTGIYFDVCVPFG